MTGCESSKLPISKKVTDELVEFTVIAAYLWVCFTAIFFFKATILKDQGIHFAPFGFAAVKALICAKFVLIGRAFRVGERFNNMPLIWPTLDRSLVFFLLLLILNALEEIVVGLMHGRKTADSLSAMGGGSVDQLVATSIVGLLILIPFFAFRVLGEAVGERNLVRVFLQPRGKLDISELCSPWPRALIG